jgi:hypothetical protein
LLLPDILPYQQIPRHDIFFLFFFPVEGNFETMPMHSQCFTLNLTSTK